MRVAVAASACVLLSCVARAQNADPPTANPARPTVTNPATLPPVGYLQLEQGYLGSLDSPEASSQYGVNQVGKIAVHPRLLLEYSSQPFAHSTVAGSGTSNEPGAVQAGLQVVLFTPNVASPAAGGKDRKTPVPTASIAYLHTVYPGFTPDTDLGSVTNSVILLFSGDLGSVHYDTNYQFNEQDGDAATHSFRRAQYGQTLSVNRSFFNPNLQLGVELYHFTQPLVQATASGTAIARANSFDILFAPSYAVRPNLVVDFGFTHGFTSTSTQWQSIFGFTYLLPHRFWSAPKAADAVRSPKS